MSDQNNEEKSIQQRLKEVVMDVEPKGVIEDAQAAGLEVEEVSDFRSQDGNYFIIEKMSEEYAGRAKRWCAASGASAGVGGIGTAIALGGTDLANMAAQLYWLCQRLAILHGFDPDKPLQRDRAQEIYFMALGFDAGARAALKQQMVKAAGKAGKPWATRNWIIRLIMEVSKQLGKEITTKQAGKFIPVFGGVIGGSANYFFARSAANKMQRMFKDDYFDRWQTSNNQ